MCTACTSKTNNISLSVYVLCACMCLLEKKNTFFSCCYLQVYQFTQRWLKGFHNKHVCVRLCYDCQIEQLKQELNRKESEMQALQTKLETLTNQNSDCKQHIEVLKESLNAKEQRANTLQTEVSTHTLTNIPTQMQTFTRVHWATQAFGKTHSDRQMRLSQSKDFCTWLQ